MFINQSINQSINQLTGDKVGIVDDDTAQRVDDAGSLQTHSLITAHEQILAPRHAASQISFLTDVNDDLAA
jgi:hypothetical protein